MPNKNFKSLYSNFFQIIFDHFRILYTDLDAVKDAAFYCISGDQLYNSQNSKLLSKFNNNRFAYLFPLLIMSYIAFSDLLYIFLHYHDGFKLSELPDLFPHRLFPQPLWSQSDTMVAIAYFMTISIYFCLFFTSRLEFRWFMFLFVDKTGKKVKIIQNGRLLKQDEAIQIYQLQSQVKKYLPYAVATISSQIGFFVVYNFFSSPNFKLNSLRDFSMLVVVFPFIPYLLFTNFILIYYFVLNSRYLRAKQKCIMKKLVSLEQRKLVFSSTSETFWSNFRNLNSDLVTFNKELTKGQNCFWQKYLSIYFSIYMVEICYLTYCFFFLSKTVNLTSYILISAAVNFVIILFYVTLQCSKIVNTNVTVFRQTMRMAMLRVANYKGDKKEFRKVLNHLRKINLMAANEQFTREDVSFTLVTGHQINSTMFQTVAIYTLMFFMIVFKDNENIQ